MAKVHGFPGEWARVNGVVMGLWPLFVWIFVGGFSLAMFCFFSAALGAIGLVMAVAWIIWNLRLGLKKVESFFKGAKGEERIAAILQDLPDDCQIFHDYVAGKDHIDHVAVTPSGIYAIETKFGSGKVTLEDGRILVDGKLPARSPVAQALRETEEIRNKLKTMGWTGYITPIVAFASDTFDGDQAELKGVTILNSSALKAYLMAHPSILTQLELDRIVKLMEE